MLFRLLLEACFSDIVQPSFVSGLCHTVDLPIAIEI